MMKTCTVAHLKFHFDFLVKARPNSKHHHKRISQVSNPERSSETEKMLFEEVKQSDPDIGVNKLIRTEALPVYKLRLIVGDNLSWQLKQYPFWNLQPFLRNAVVEMAIATYIDLPSCTNLFPQLKAVYQNSMGGIDFCLEKGGFDAVHLIEVFLNSTELEYSLTDVFLWCG